MPGFSQHSYTLDEATRLKDAGLVAADAAAQVGGSDRILDFGNVTSGPAVEQIAYTEADLVIDVSALEFGSADEFYQIVYQLSDDTSGDGVGFASGDVIVNYVAVPMGLAGGLPDSGAANESATGRVKVRVSNEHKGETFRFARLFTVVAGTIATGINYEAFLSLI